MTKRELLVGLRRVRRAIPKGQVPVAVARLDELIEEVKDHGVLDVQCPPDVAKWMGLSRPA